MDARPNGSWVVIDEIQRISGLLNEVHRTIEEKKLHFALLGSSARKLRRAGTNLLGGRALKKMMDPLLPQELGTLFDLDQVLRFGSLPLIWNADDRQEQLEAYVQLYLKEEIQTEALVRNLPGFMRFLPTASLFHGQVLNVQALSRDAGVSRSTVAGYLDILEDTLLAFRLPAYEGRLRVKERTHPKLYWNDLGVMRAARRSFHAPTAEEKGALLEGYVVQLLRAYRNLGKSVFDEMHYWSSSESSVEVDFLLHFGASSVAIEIKASDKIHPRHLSGLKAISHLKGLRRRMVVYLGTRPMRIDNIDIVPLEDFLVALEKETLV
jgi:predicted AAA+ superfamily ATPase